MDLTISARPELRSQSMPRDHETCPAKSRKKSGHPPQLHDDLLFDEILTRLPPATAVRCRAVCRAWNAALTSDDFLRAYRARSAGAHHPELLFFLPGSGSGATTTISLYTRTLRDGEAPRAARELLTVGNLSAEHVVLTSRPCHGLTLILDAQASEHYVCNLSTGQHVALPPCEQAAPMESLALSRVGLGKPQFPISMPLEIASVGLGFDPATGTHKVVRLFRKRMGETSCEVCAPGDAGGWRPCAGRVPPPAASFVAGLPPVFLGGSLYWLLMLNSFTGADQPIMSFSVGAEQFGWVPMPPLLVRRVGALTDLDGSLCAVVDIRDDAKRYGIFTWSGGTGTGTGWSMRCSINLQRLPRPISYEFQRERHVLPLCSAGGKILLATGRHRVFAYDPERVTMERVFYIGELVDVPDRHREARLLNIGLHEQSIVSVGHHQQTPPSPSSRLQVKLGSNTVGKRRVFDRLRDSYEDLARLEFIYY